MIGMLIRDTVRTFIEPILNVRVIATISTASFYLGVVSVGQTPGVFPPAANLVDITKSPYNAIPNDGIDDTAKIQQAIVDLAGRQYGFKTIFFPNGVYDVNNTLIWDNESYHRGKYLMMRGQSKDGVVIKLNDNCPGFGDRVNPKPVIDTFTTGNESYGKYICDLTVNVGSGNPGAIGIEYLANNLGSIRNVKVVSEDGQGKYGFAFIDAWPGPMLIKNVEVVGFDYGIFIDQGLHGVTFEHISLQNQRIAGITTTENAIFIRGLQSNNSVPALTTTRSSSLVVLLDSNLAGGSPACSAIELAQGTGMWARNITTSGYQSGIKYGSAVIAGTRISEWASHEVESVFPTSPKSLNLPIKETPDYENWDHNDWANVADYGARGADDTDDTAAIQRALNSGKPIVYFPEMSLAQVNSGVKYNWYRVRNTIAIPSSVRKIFFLQQPLYLLDWAGGADPLFRIEGDASDPPLIIDCCTTIHTYQLPPTLIKAIWHHKGSRTAVFRDSRGRYEAEPGAGDVFFDDYIGGSSAGLIFQLGQNIWARQFNTEDLGNSPNPLVRNYGADLWIFGQKTEGAKIIIKTTNGGRTELCGGFYYPVHLVPSDLPLYINEESSFSAAGFLTVNYVNPDYEILVKETRDGDTRDLHQSDVPGRNGTMYSWAAKVPLYTGYKLAKRNGDFDDNDHVGTEDFSIFASAWMTRPGDENWNPLCDICEPFDNLINASDLVVFAAYWLKEVVPVGMVAYWKLDETQGSIAHDSAVDNDGTLNGEPIWQPTGGKIAGALQFDGIDDYIRTGLVLNPADSPFSVFAWIKAGRSGQVIISQKDAMNWLQADATEGKLMTQLKSPGRFGNFLISQAVITDDNWHRIGLVWDGSNRKLYVDDVEVAKDTQSNLAGSTGGLYIGAGKGLEAGSFWSGLIDDVRIYDRAITP
jgi:hypothetical protein